MLHGKGKLRLPLQAQGAGGRPPLLSELFPQLPTAFQGLQIAKIAYQLNLKIKDTLGYPSQCNLKGTLNVEEPGRRVSVTVK